MRPQPMHGPENHRGPCGPAGQTADYTANRCVGLNDVVVPAGESTVDLERSLDDRPDTDTPGCAERMQRYASFVKPAVEKVAATEGDFEVERARVQVLDKKQDKKPHSTRCC